MELLIPGLILVALMVYASTKIKNSAAEAYEKEVIETDEIYIIKPADFISLVDPGEGLLFSARSKECGYDAAGDQSRASAQIKFIEATSPDDIIVSLKESEQDNEIMIKDPVQIGDEKYITAETFEIVSGIRSNVTYRWIESTKGVYELRVRVLEDHSDEFVSAVDTLIDSFRMTAG